MALTFYLESQKYDGRYMYLSCIQSPDISTNTSRIDWTFVSTGGSDPYYATGPTVVKINGQQVFYAEMMGWTARKFPTAKGSVSGSLTVPHNDDGTASIEVLLSTAIYYEKVEDHKATWELNKIDRFATILSAPNFNDNQNPTITYSNPAGNNVDLLLACISLDGSKDDIAYRAINKTGSSYTFNLTESERNVLRAATTGSNARTVMFVVTTSIGGNTGHSTLTRTLSVGNAGPILSPVVIDTNSKTVKVTGDNKILVALHSTAQVTLNATAQKGATITSRKIEHGNQVLTKDGILSVTNNPIKFTVVDSRGNTTTQYATNTIVPYINPTCSVGNNLPNTDGTFELEVSGLFYNGTIGKTTNALTLQYRYREGYGDYTQWVNFKTVTKNGNSYAATESLTGLDYKTSYTFQARAIDAINTDGVVSGDKKAIAEPVFFWGKNDFQFNVPVTLKDGCDILKDGAAAYAPAGLNGEAVQLVNSEEELNDAIATAYNNAANHSVEFKTIDVNASDMALSAGVWQFMINKADSSNGTVYGASYNYNGFAYRALRSRTWEDWQKYTPSAFAPSGYGLGTKTPTTINGTEELDACQTSGFYRYVAYDSNICGISFNFAGLTVYPMDDNECIQELRPLSTSYCLRRFYFDGAWSSWELVGMVMQILWVNASPASNFAAQTIHMDLSKYKAVYVQSVRSTDDQTVSGGTLAWVDIGSNYLTGTTDQHAATRRKVTATSSGITFSGFSSANTSDGASNEIPWVICGIRGINW